MQYNPVGWFEIPATDLERAQKFYEELLGIKMRREDVPGYEMVWFPSDEKAKGIPGALMKGTAYNPRSHGTVIYFTCPDIEGTLLRAEKMGSEIILPKKDIGKWGTIAWITDSEGNFIGLHSRKSFT
jgi:predicted enzyme related to lactoylglutathione lyase